MADVHWTQQMDRFQVPEQRRHTVPILAADLDSVPYVPGGGETPEGVARIDGRYYVSNEHMMRYLAGMYNPQAIPDLRATIQIAFVPPKGVDYDPGPANWYMNINDGKCTVHQGRTAVPTLTISTPHEVWQDIGTGLRDADAAFTDGEFDAEGSMLLMEQFPQVFQYPQPGEGSRVSHELDMIMMGMPLVFSAFAAAGLDATIQFVLGGTGGGMYHLRIKDGECTAHREPFVDATLTINAPAEIWLAITKGGLDGQQAFMSGQYRATGDMNLMMKMGNLFKSAAATPAPTLDSQPAQEEPPMVDMTTLNCHDTIAGMPTAFNAEAAGDLKADIQFRVTGEESGTYYLHIENGVCTFREGESPAPTLTIRTPSEVWLAVSRGEMDGQMAFMQQKYTVEGEFGLLMKMSQLFKT
jgi:putative sterol carrier protein